MEIFHVLCYHKKGVTLKAVAFEYSIYTCFVCLCVGRKWIYKRMWNRESNQKSGLHSHCAANKNVTRLGAADTETSLPLLFSLLSHWEVLLSKYFLHYSKGNGFIHSFLLQSKWASKLPIAIKSETQLKMVPMKNQSILHCTVITSDRDMEKSGTFCV